VKRFLILFATTHDALRAEQHWPQTGYPGKLRPIPRVLSASCGLCLQTDLPEHCQPQTLLEQANLEWEQIVEVLGKEYCIRASKT
jgi:hypothetical protein